MCKTRGKKMLSLILCMVLIAAMALCATGCKGSKNASGADAGAVNPENPTDGQESDVSDASTDDALPDSDVEAVGAENGESSDVSGVAEADENVLGQGETEFLFTVTDVDGNETSFTVRTDKKLVGEALQDVGLIDGEAGPYGLYVKTVNGIKLDFDTDGKYWAFYVDGAYGMAGVDTTEIKEGEVYAFKAE